MDETLYYLTLGTFRDPPYPAIDQNATGFCSQPLVWLKEAPVVKRLMKAASTCNSA